MLRLYPHEKGKYFKSSLWHSVELGRIITSPDKNALEMPSRIWKYVSVITFHSLLPEHTQLQMMQWSTISQGYQKVSHSICIVMEISFSDWRIVFTHNSSWAEAVFSRKAQGCPTWDICKSVLNYRLRDRVRRSQIQSLVLWITVSFYMIKNKILGCRALWYLYCHPLTFCLLEQTALPCEAIFSIAMPVLHVCLGLAGYSKIRKGTFTLRLRCSAGAQAQSASLGLNLGVTSTGFLSTRCWISAESVK